MIMFMNKYSNKISGFSSRGEGGKPVWTKRGQTRGQFGGREGELKTCKRIDVKNYLEESQSA